MDYWDSIDYLLALPDLERFSSGPGGQTMSLEAMKAVLTHLGNPHLGRRTVHVTGSKGKGSTSTMIASVLHESGYRTALYTSPHLHDYVERISLDMLPVSRFEFAEAVAEIRDAIDDVNLSDLGPVSTFGAMTALFFHLCRKNNCEWQVVEVGLGGKHDATNMFDTKDAAVITAISLEHTAVLGNTCAEIAREKAGIITPACATVLAQQKDPAVLELVRTIVSGQNSTMLNVEESTITPISHDSNGQSFSVQTSKRTYKLHTAMLGMHQLENAATAVVTAEALSNAAPKIDKQSIEKGIANAEIAGRMEQLTRHPLTLVDGAHNGDSMLALTDAIDRHFDFDDVIVVLGVNNDKNLGEILDALKEIQPTTLIATKSQNTKALMPEKIAAAATERGLAARVTQSVGDAIDLAKELARPNDLVCLTGSLYIAGEAREKILVLPIMH